MAASNFTTVISVDKPAKEVFNSINDARDWWQGEIEGDTDKLNSEFTYRMKDMHFSRQKIVELVPNEKIVWLVTDSKLSFTKDAEEWSGTKIVFEISEANGKTQIRFTHLGLIPEIECFNNCSNGWSRLIQESLFNLITTGKGVNVFG